MASSMAVAGQASHPARTGAGWRWTAPVALLVAAALALLALDLYVTRAAGAPDADALANVAD